MSKLDKVRELLQKALLAFGQVSTNKGIVCWIGESELPEIGASVNGVDEEGNDVALEDGEYKLENGTVIVIAEGKVAEIREPEIAAEPEAESNDEVAEEMEGEVVVEPIIEPEVPVEPEAEPVVIEPTVEERVAALEATVAMLAERLAALEAKPVAEPATEEFKKVNSYKNTGDKQIDRLQRILNA